MFESEDTKTISSFENRIYFGGNVPDYILLNSQGGNVYHGTPVYDYIRYHKIDTIAEGTCQSMAFIVFTAGERRISYPSTLFMHHGSKISGSLKNRRKCRKTYENAFEDSWIDRMVEISNKPRKYWEKTVKHSEDHYFWTARELKEMGVVTHIIGEDL